MTQDLSPRLRRDIAKNFDRAESKATVAASFEDERRMIFRIVLTIAAVCLVAMLSGS